MMYSWLYLDCMKFVGYIVDCFNIGLLDFHVLWGNHTYSDVRNVQYHENVVPTG